MEIKSPIPRTGDPIQERGQIPGIRGLVLVLVPGKRHPVPETRSHAPDLLPKRGNRDLDRMILMTLDRILTLDRIPVEIFLNSIHCYFYVRIC